MYNHRCRSVSFSLEIGFQIPKKKHMLNDGRCFKEYFFLVDLPTLNMVDQQFAVDVVLSTRLSQGGGFRCLFFVAMMLLVSTFHENFAMLRRGVLVAFRSVSREK